MHSLPLLFAWLWERTITAREDIMPELERLHGRIIKGGLWLIGIFLLALIFTLKWPWIAYVLILLSFPAAGVLYSHPRMLEIILGVSFAEWTLKWKDTTIWDAIKKTTWFFFFGIVGIADVILLLGATFASQIKGHPTETLMLLAGSIVIGIVSNQHEKGSLPSKIVGTTAWLVVFYSILKIFSAETVEPIGEFFEVGPATVTDVAMFIAAFVALSLAEASLWATNSFLIILLAAVVLTAIGHTDIKTAKDMPSALEKGANFLKNTFSNGSEEKPGEKKEGVYQETPGSKFVDPESLNKETPGAQECINPEFLKQVDFQPNNQSPWKKLLVRLEKGTYKFEPTGERSQCFAENNKCAYWLTMEGTGKLTSGDKAGTAWYPPDKEQQTLLPVKDGPYGAFVYYINGKEIPSWKAGAIKITAPTEVMADTNIFRIPEVRKSQGNEELGVNIYRCESGKKRTPREESKEMED